LWEKKQKKQRHPHLQTLEVVGVSVLSCGGNAETLTSSVKQFTRYDCEKAKTPTSPKKKQKKAKTPTSPNIRSCGKKSKKSKDTHISKH
jgi:hypothetical protein